MKPAILHGAKLRSITLHLSLQGRTWQGFIAEKEVRLTYAPGEWPGLKRAIAELSEWGDCVRETVRPFFGQLQHTLSNGYDHYQYLSRELPWLECEPLQGESTT